ncbi:MAG: hypothetical protein RI897_1053 [Verrucomicrobiota bacterium]|jgi:hypothetical protein
MHAFRESLATDIEPYRSALLSHPVYERLSTLGDLHIFMEYHAFAVWDFMSLLKALQLRLTCVAVPWMPVGDGRVRRLVNEIVLAEESDETESGVPASHYELYLEAMREAGAQVGQVSLFVEQLGKGASVEGALSYAAVPLPVAAFVNSTFKWIEEGKVHRIAAAFTYGREDLIPAMFHQLVVGLDRRVPDRLSKLRYYLERHIQLDGDVHGELGREMVELLCAGDPQKEREAIETAVQALKERIALWDGILAALPVRGVGAER